MVSSSATRAKFPVPLLVAGALIVLALIAGGIYFARTPVATSTGNAASPEAKAYLPNLRLTDVSMKATENFMKQQVVEIEGKIANNGSRALRSIEIYCYFSGTDGRPVDRERIPIVQSSASPLKPGEVRDFRLPFDNLPDTWNQALPRMVIAQITFAQ